VLAAWKDKGYTTGWIPWVAYEITSSNFIENDDVVSQRLVEEIVRAVKRFDILAEGDVLPDVDQLFVRSIYDTVNEPGGPSHIHKDEDDLRLRIHICKQVTRRNQIGRENDGKGSYYVAFQDGKINWFKPFRSTFASHAPKAVNAMKRVIEVAGITKFSTDEEVAKAIQPLSLPMIQNRAAKLNVPQHVIDAVTKLWDPPPPPTNNSIPPEPWMMPDAAFTVTTLAECWFYAEFARERLKRKFKDNDGPDFKIATYMSQAEHFVTNDGDLRNLISHYMREAERRIIRSSRFYRTCGALGQGPAAPLLEGLPSS
jgi:hypothetical protein